MKKYLAFQYLNETEYIKSRDIESDRVMQLVKKIKPVSIIYFDGKNRFYVKSVEMANNIYSCQF